MPPSLFNYLTEPEEVWTYGTKLFELIANGELNVKVHKEYEFRGKGVQDAQTDLVSGKTTGKLIIRVSGE
jgi:NADPH2:quinone reductase